MRLIDLVRIFKYLAMRKSRSTFAIDPPKSGMNSFMANRYLASFAVFISEGETLLNGSKGFQIFVGSIDGRHVEALSHVEALIGITNRKIIIVYDKMRLFKNLFSLTKSVSTQLRTVKATHS